MADLSFGERLARLRKQAGMTQQAVANALNIHRTSYTKYETGVAAPDQQGLILLAQLFNVSVDYLVGHETTSPSLDSDTEGDVMRLSLQEQLLVQMFRQLNYADQQTWVREAQQTFRQIKKNTKK